MLTRDAYPRCPSASVEGKEARSRETGYAEATGKMETSSPARVLVVDEHCNPDSAIEGMLKKGEYSTVLSSGRDEAIVHIERDPPYDLVLSDLMMAGLGGHGLIERLRAVQPDTPLVLLTASHDGTQPWRQCARGCMTTSEAD